ncbi:MAG: RNA polymerase sigma factor [Sulfuricella denitrificans]|nr:RNA polymerase sigma factor [Sulfuricella denitrificans]
MSKTEARIEEHIPSLRRYARALLGSRAPADDLVQDTLERAWGRFHLWRSGSDLRAWLFTIMHNLYVNQLRQGNYMPATVPLDEEAWKVSVRAAQEDGLEMRDLMAALNRLPEEFREVVLLVGLEQLRYEEVAQVLDIPLGTVMSRLARGRERLRALMSATAPPTLRRIK